GGAIDNQGTLTLDRSTLSGNRAVTGGGIHGGTQGRTTVANSTVTDNQASDLGGGITATSFQGTLSPPHGTLTANTARSGGGIAGRGSVADTIVAGNTAASAPDVAGTFTSGGGNVIGTLDLFGAGFGQPGSSDQVGVSALLGPLQDNGGPTLTRA